MLKVRILDFHFKIVNFNVNNVIHFTIQQKPYLISKGKFTSIITQCLLQ